MFIQINFLLISCYFFVIHLGMKNQLPTDQPELLGNLIYSISQSIEEFDPYISNLFAVHGDDVSVSAIFIELANFTIELFRLEPSKELHDQIATIFELLENILENCDEESRIQIGVSFLSDLPVTLITSYLLAMGPCTLEILENLE